VESKFNHFDEVILKTIAFIRLFSGFFLLALSAYSLEFPEIQGHLHNNSKLKIEELTLEVRISCTEIYKGKSCGSKILKGDVDLSKATFRIPKAELPEPKESDYFAVGGRRIEYRLRLLLPKQPGIYIAHDLVNFGTERIIPLLSLYNLTI
jgi:hypothetical protein